MVSPALVPWSLWEQCYRAGNPRRLWDTQLEGQWYQTQQYTDCLFIILVMSKFFHPSYRKLSAITTMFFPEKDLLAWLIISPWIEQSLDANLPDMTSNFCCLWGSPVNPQQTPWEDNERTGLLQRKKQSFPALLSANCLIEQVCPEAMEDQIWAGSSAQEGAGSVPLSFPQGPLSFWFLSSFCLFSLYFTHPPEHLLNNTTYLCAWPDFTWSRASLILL